ncbi:PAS domain-containing protein [Dongia soli]|uniref:PAS domain-containing protein n=1 Tax=Dongia soli TaxID=600628 RepID=A0ABU5EI94_9PROT|nr:PAS domain-containing protein [Dongia soli]MDY0885896.1 PAS domain-containing protein [Dongia soli]
MLKRASMVGEPGGSSPVHQLYDYWLSKSRDRRIPSRADIYPEEIPQLLPYVMLHDVVRQNGFYRFKARLIGTHIVDVCGSNPTGRYIDEYMPREDYKKIYETLTGVITTKAPAHGVVPVHGEDGYFLDFEVITMPLSYDGEQVDMFFCGRRAIFRKGNSTEK